MLSKYLDPKNDLAFKKIFGSEKHKNIPISFLNAVFNLSGDDLIVDLEFLNPIQPPEISARRVSIVDVLVHDRKGTKYIVEMQVAKISGFEKQAQFYAAKTYYPGHAYGDFERIVFLALTDYIVFPGTDKYKSDRVVLNRESYKNELKNFSFTFIELPKFTTEDYRVLSLEEKWYYFFKHANKKNTIPEILKDDPDIVAAYSILEYFNWTEQEIAWYEEIAFSVVDFKCAIEAARNEGIAEAIAERIAQGKAEGETKAKVQIAKKMLARGDSMQFVTAFCELTESEIKIVYELL